MFGQDPRKWSLVGVQSFAASFVAACQCVGMIRTLSPLTTTFSSQSSILHSLRTQVFRV